ncbi:Biotin carboxyl carrier protein of acetyl-CoA carboxylase [hydrothermal vent metagenome]|uniref:Biotin carboxyl carrier protein of acetyl-CoA carboxylase n=1 Tax=hydrothermal vent metagenome TaxID=652676 RepID=A0A3B0T519_9ZZZZ
MTSRLSRWFVRLSVLLLVMLSASPAFASSIGISVGAPETVTVGQQVEVKAILVEDGQPVVGAEVALTYQTTFGGRSGSVELATATTDESGVALMVYEQRAAHNDELQIVYLGPGTDPVDSYSFSIAVAEGGAQLYQSESGVEIPFVNGTLVILVISLVWFLIALAAIRLVQVGKAGKVGKLVSDDVGEEGSMWIGVALASAAIFTALGMVIVFVRAPVSNTDLTDPAVYDRTPIGYIDATYPYEGFGLADTSSAQTGDPVVDGKALSLQYGCAACHAPTGLGGVVGVDLIEEVGSFNSFVEDVREGPKGMPAYSESSLSDADLQKIYDFLKARE